MESKELIEYIKSQINNGVSKEEITKILQEQGGWADKDITDAFSVVEIDEQIQNPEVEKVEEKKEQTETNQIEQTQQSELSEKPKSKTVSSRLGLLIVLLLAIVVAVGAKYYMDYYTASEISDVSDMLEQVEENQEVKGEVASSTEQELSSEELPSEYEIKADGVYYDGELLKEIDLETFEYLGDYYSKDENSVYMYGEIFEGVDSATFEKLGYENSFSKDKNNVYWDREVIEAADPDSFVIIKDGYSKDDLNVYFLNIKVDSASPDSFVVIKYGYSKDDSNFYFLSKKIKDVDRNTFEVFGVEGLNSFARDKNHLFLGDIQLAMDPETFKILGSYAKDEEGFYWIEGYVPHLILKDPVVVNVYGVDEDSFEHISFGYAKDKNNVYHDGKKIENADVDTFEVADFRFAKDGNSVYLYGEMVPGVNPVNCTAENLDGCKRK